MSATACVEILARLSNPQAVKRASGPFSNGKPDKKIAANEPSQRVSAFHPSGQNFQRYFSTNYTLQSWHFPSLSPPVPILNVLIYHFKNTAALRKPKEVSSILK